MHQSATIFLPAIDDTVVLNKQTGSQSDHAGIYSDNFRRYGGTGYSMGSSEGASRAMGDVSFIQGGKPIVTFYQVFDPQGLAEVAKSIKEQLFVSATESDDIKSKSYIPEKTKRDDKLKCNKCGSPNPGKSVFCNKCVSPLAAISPECNKENTQDSKFCNAYGSLLA